MIMEIIKNNWILTDTLLVSYTYYCATPNIEEVRKKTKFTMFVSIIAVHNHSKLTKILRYKLINIFEWVKLKFSEP